MRRFSLYRRGRIFYCQFYNQKTRKYLPGRSTGQTNRDSAILVVYDWEQNGIPDRGGAGCRPVSETIDVDTVLETIRKTDLTAHDAERIIAALKTRGLIETAVVKAGPGSELFAAFLSRFWDYDESPYVREKLAHGHSIGRRHCYDMSIWLKLYWQPYFGDKRLSQIQKTDLKRFSLWLAESKKLKPKTINNILSAGTVALRWAKANELIAVNPAEGLMKFSGDTTERKILTESQARQLFSVEWADERARIGNLLAMTTGLRAGEVLGLQVRDIGEDRLYVRHSWSNKEDLKNTKTGEKRTIPLLATVREALLNLARKNPHGIGPTSFIFWSVRREDRPMDFHFLLDGLKNTLLKLSLTDAELKDPEKVRRARGYWRQRAVVFHSWRHYFATHLADRVEQLFTERLEYYRAGLNVPHRTKRYGKAVELVGKLKEKYPRAAKLYEVEVKPEADKPATDKSLKAVDIVWKEKEGKYDRETTQEGSYVLRTDRLDLGDEEIWSIYTMLGQIEYAFMCMKSSLGLRPNFHQKEQRVDTHMFISVVAYHLLHAIESRLRAGGDRRKWPTVCNVLRTHERMTIGYRVKAEDGSIGQKYVRVNSRLEPEHLEIYRMFGLSGVSLPRRRLAYNR